MVKKLEEEFQNQIIELAHLFGWRVAHFRAAQTAKGWRTAVSADGKGFPDLVLVKAGRLIFAEIKTDDPRSKTSEDQDAWLEALRTVAGVLVVVWRPSDWDAIEPTLRGNDYPILN